jgi:hypothetical protein
VVRIYHLHLTTELFTQYKEFGIDIVDEDKKTIIHHNFATRVVCVFSETDLQVVACAEQYQRGCMLPSIPPKPWVCKGGRR